MKLALVLPVWDGGVQPSLFWQRILEELDEIGITSDVIVTRVRPLIRKEDPLVRKEGPLVREDKEPPVGRRAYLPSMTLVRSLLGSSAHVFVCVEYGVSTALCIAIAKLRRRRAIIFQEHAGREGQSLAGWERRYRWLVGTCSDGVIANTDAAFAEATQGLRIDRRKIFRATILVPPEREAHVREAVSAPQPAQRPLFLFVGQLVDRKNVSKLIDAAATLRSRGYEFEVWIVGDGYRRSSLEAQARDLTAEGVVRFLGSWAPSEIGATYEAADVFVMPTLRDYRSVAVLEALRFGKPVIDSVRDGNAGDLVRHETTGLVFDPQESDALLAAMERAIVDPEMLRTLGQNAFEMMRDQTPRAAAAALHRILKTVQSR